LHGYFFIHLSAWSMNAHTTCIVKNLSVWKTLGCTIHYTYNKIIWMRMNFYLYSIMKYYILTLWYEWRMIDNNTRRNTLIKEREKHGLFCFKIKYIVLYALMGCVLFPDFESVYMNSFQKLDLCYRNVVDWWVDVTKFKKWEYGVVLYVVFIQRVMETGHMFQALGKLWSELNWNSYTEWTSRVKC
jgi:hypothetical protein